MASITVRNIPESTKRKLRSRAASHGRSMEEEVRQILNAAVEEREMTGKEWVASIRRRFVPLGGLDLPEIPREPMREPPNFE
jgi:plasmid stability protein